MSTSNSKESVEIDLGKRLQAAGLPTDLKEVIGQKYKFVADDRNANGGSSVVAGEIIGLTFTVSRLFLEIHLGVIEIMSDGSSEIESTNGGRYGGVFELL